MHPRRLDERLSTGFAIVLGILVSGCERQVLYEVRGTIRNAVDGQPVEGVRAMLLVETAGKQTRHVDSSVQPRGPSVVADANGSFSLRFEYPEGLWEYHPK
jgi:hypothetical protein